MKELQTLGVSVVEMQRNSYDPHTLVHKRSYMCCTMSKDNFAKIKEILLRYDLLYLTQSNTLWDLSMFGGRDGVVWVTRKGGENTHYICLTNDVINIKDNDIYVVIWSKRFLPRAMLRARLFDIDTILLCILKGKCLPRLRILRLLRGCFCFS
jgi:hypothetical protein